LQREESGFDEQPRTERVTRVAAPGSSSRISLSNLYYGTRFVFDTNIVRHFLFAIVKLY
jgi:hypothetical protein